MPQTIQDNRDLTVVPLRRAVKEFLDHCKDIRNLASSTRATYKAALGCLMDVCEPTMDTYLFNETHVQMALAKATRGDTDREYALRRAENPSASRRTGRSKSSLSIDKAAFRQFQDYCQSRRYLSVYDRPTRLLRNANNRAERSRRQHERWIVPYGQWSTLLDMAGSRHPRDRFVCAMGLYGGRRWSDYKDMRISDIDLTQQTFSFINQKAGGKRVTLPYKLFPEFTREVHRWMGWLGGQFGELDPDWYLIPSRVNPKDLMQFDRFQAPDMRPGWPVVPTQTPTHPTIVNDIHLALELIAAPMDKHLGPHTMRHSCSNWLLDEQKWALEHVSIWLDHSDTATTKQIYLSGAEDGNRLWKIYGNGPTSDEPELSPFQVRRAKRHLELLGAPDGDEDAA